MALILIMDATKRHKESKHTAVIKPAFHCRICSFLHYFLAYRSTYRVFSNHAMDIHTIGFHVICTLVVLIALHQTPAIVNLSHWFQWLLGLHTHPLHKSISCTRPGNRQLIFLILQSTVGSLIVMSYEYNWKGKQILNHYITKYAEKAYKVRNCNLLRHF